MLDFMVDFGIYIRIQVLCAQLVATGGPWVTHQYLANQIQMIFLFKAKIGSLEPENSLNS